MRRADSWTGSRGAGLPAHDGARHLGTLLVLAGCILACTEAPKPLRYVPPPPTALAPPEPLPCLDDGVLEASVEIRDQRDIDRLEGCTRILGDVGLFVYSGLDYLPLRSLRDVEGTLSVSTEGTAPVPQPLEPLRSLEEAGGLQLTGLQIESLEPLSGLRRLGAATSQLPARDEIEKDTAPEDRSPVGFYGLSIAGCSGLTSLSGLDSLAELDALVVSNNPDLASLSGLPGLSLLPEVTLFDGRVDLRDALPIEKLTVYASSWTDLSPLGDARSLKSLALLQNSALATLTGAELPERLEGLGLTNNPALANVDGLQALRDIEQLSIATINQFGAPVESRLTSLEGLSGLERVGQWVLYGNTQLHNLAGLGALKQIDRWELTDNTALQSLDGLSSLERVGMLFLSYSPGLLKLSGLGAARIGSLNVDGIGIADLTGLERVSIETELRISSALQLASLRGLPQFTASASLHLYELPMLTDAGALGAVTGLADLTLQKTALLELVAAGLQRLGVLTVWENQRLLQLSMPSLRSVEQLQVLANFELRRLDLRQLDAVQQLEITNNHLLGERQLEHLLELGAAPSVVDRNGGRGTPLAPCPWLGDGWCDETNRVCAAGTDAADCSSP